MLLLKGKRGKSIVIHGLAKTVSDVHIYVFDRMPLSVQNTIYVSSNYNDLNTLCEMVKNDMTEEYTEKEMLVIYTELPEKELDDVKALLLDLEERQFCRNTVLTCR
ncbi:MAG: hypothetical protein ACI39W_10875 [Brotaphodocola sp.]